MRPGRLYKRLGLTGAADKLVDVVAGSHDLGDNVHSIRVNRGGSDLSSYSASTVTVETPVNVPVANAGKDLSITLDEDAVETIGNRVGEEPSEIFWRYRGRIATQTAHDKQRRRHQAAAWRGTRVVGAAWASLYEHAPDEFTPGNGTTLLQAAQALFLPTWAPFATLEWRGDTEPWPTGPHDPITAADLLRLLSGRLYMLGDTRHGHFRVEALNRLEDHGSEAAADTWPVARAHVLEPTTWEQPSTYPTEYRIKLLAPSGVTHEIITSPTGVPTGETRLVDQDWSHVVQVTDQWRRIYGRRWESFQTYWRMPSLSVRLDYLIASPYVAHRRAAGTLLRLNVGDPVPLAGDWPSAITGIHYATSLEENITVDAWTLNIGLTPYNAIAGQPQLPVKPRTWHQAGNRTWQDAGPATWNEGITA